jgi:prolyl-tRNA synthetase
MLYIKGKGVQNAYFPLFIPMSFLSKEADHVDGAASPPPFFWEDYVLISA